MWVGGSVGRWWWRGGREWWFRRCLGMVLVGGGWWWKVEGRRESHFCRSESSGEIGEGEVSVVMVNVGCALEGWVVKASEDSSAVEAWLSVVGDLVVGRGRR